MSEHREPSEESYTAALRMVRAWVRFGVLKFASPADDEEVAYDIACMVDRLPPISRAPGGPSC